MGNTKKIAIVLAVILIIVAILSVTWFKIIPMLDISTKINWIYQPHLEADLEMPNVITKYVDGKMDTIIKTDIFRIQNDILKIPYLNDWECLWTDNFFMTTESKRKYDYPMSQQARYSIALQNKKDNNENIFIHISQNTEIAADSGMSINLEWENPKLKKDIIPTMQKIVEACTNKEVADYVIYKKEMDEEDDLDSWEMIDVDNNKTNNTFVTFERKALYDEGIWVNICVAEELPFVIPERESETKTDYRTKGNLSKLNEFSDGIPFFVDIEKNQEIKNKEGSEFDKFSEWSSVIKQVENDKTCIVTKIAKEYILDNKIKQITRTLYYDEQGNLIRYGINPKNLFYHTIQQIHEEYPDIVFEDSDEVIEEQLRQNIIYQGKCTYKDEDGIVKINNRLKIQMEQGDPELQDLDFPNKITIGDFEIMITNGKNIGEKFDIDQYIY